MKKIIILLSCLILTGCYDYVELNSLSLVVGIGIDKIDDKFTVSFEILNNQKTTPNEGNIKSKLVSATNKNLSLAINEASQKTAKKAYYAHLKILLLGETLSDKDIKEVIDYCMRSPEIRNEFYLVTTKNSSAKDILSLSSEANPVVSNQIETMLNNNDKRSNNSSPLYFEEIIQGYYNKNIDIAITILEIINNKLSVEGIAIYDNFILKDYLNNENSLIYNIFINNSHNAEFSFKCEDNNINISIYNSNINYTLENNTINIYIKLKGSINECTCDENLKDFKTYYNLSKKYSRKINKKINNFYENLIKNNSDILGIKDQYYKKTRKKLKFNDIKVNIKTNLTINKEGLIFNL